MCRISFVVPVYKVEEFLDECITSIIGQNFGDFEVVLVDDGSPDNCPEICDKWAQKDARIRVIHKQNGGLSDARNVGLTAAKGDYVWFVDSDDFLKPDAAEIVCKVMSEYSDADVYSTALTYVKNGIHIKNDFIPTISTPISGCDYINKKYLSGAIQRFIIKRNLLIDNELYFLKGVLHEDGPFGYMLMYYAQTVVCLPRAVYCYRQRENSIMNSLTIRTSYDIIKNHQSLMIFCEKCVSEDKQPWFRILCSNILLRSYSFVKHLFGTSEFREFEKENLKYIRKELLGVFPACGIPKKILFFMFFLFPKMTTRVLYSRVMDKLLKVAFG